MSAGMTLETRLSDGVVASLGLLCPVHATDDGLKITTHCLYPSNGLVRVTVRGGLETLVVSDDGETLGEAAAAGIEIENPEKLIRNMVRQRGLLLSTGVIHTPPVEFDAASVAIVHVANAARDISTWLYEHTGLKRRRDFKTVLASFLTETFREQVAEDHIIGASHKSHTFANVISFANGRKLIVDAVSNDPSSINARVVANLDVKSVHDRTIDQRIVFDDSANWSSADLNLLQVGATIVPFSKSMSVIQRLADEARAA